ncbi:hypothetical protein REPUB_Repub04eG0123900 [Reevesia pubescens]
MDPDVVAKAFVEHYYSTFDAIQASLANLYQDGSMLTFEGQKIQGSQNFMAKFTGLPFQQCQHNITTVDCQPSGAGGILVFVFGTLQLAGEHHALKFSEVTLLSLHLSIFSFFFLFGTSMETSLLVQFHQSWAICQNLATCNENELDKCLVDWKSLGFEVSASICDVSTGAQRESLMEKVSSLYDCKLNILINNVGTNIRKPMVEFTTEEVSTLLATNFESVFNLCQLAYPLLKASGLGSVVFTSSVSGFVSLKSMSVQGATKGNIHLRRISWNADMRWEFVKAIGYSFCLLGRCGVF